MNRWILGVILVAVISVAAGCGGGGDSTTTMTKAEFTKQASAICAKGEADIRAAIADYNKKIESTPNGTNSLAYQREVAKAMVNNTIIPAMREELERLEGLTPPAEADAAASKMAKTFSLSVGELEVKGVQGLVNPEQYLRFQSEAKANGIDCSA